MLQGVVNSGKGGFSLKNSMHRNDKNKELIGTSEDSCLPKSAPRFFTAQTRALTKIHSEFFPTGSS